MKWIYKEPKTPGTYLVETKTPMGRQIAMRAYFSGKSWTFNNQVFWRYLDEEPEVTQTVRMYFSEEDANDMASSFYKEIGGLWNTWTFPIIETGKGINIQMYLGNQDDIESAEGLDEASQ